MKTPAKYVLLGLTIILLLAAPAYALRDRLWPEEQADVLSVPAVIGDVERTVLASGTIKPARLVAVGAQASGRVTSLKVKLGQVIESGELIAEIDSLTQQNALRTAEAELASIRAQRQERLADLTLAEQTLERQRRTLAQRATSHADFESAEAALAVTQAQIAALEAQIAAAEVAVANARVNLGYTRVTAPIDGMILAIVTQEGQTVNASQSAPTIVIMGQVDVMEVLAEISEADIVHVSPGQPVYFTVLGAPERRFSAELESIDPAPQSIASDSSVTTSSSGSSGSSSSSSATSAIYYNGRFNVANPDGFLRTYMTAQVHIILGAATNAVTIPSSALVRAADGTHSVRVVESTGAVTVREVEVGLDNRVTVEIRSGLTAGERVVTGEAGAAAATPTTTRRGPPSPLGF